MDFSVLLVMLHVPYETQDKSILAMKTFRKGVAGNGNHSTHNGQYILH